ncbi:MAG: hypothetical protein PUP92_14310 [Rhizonema sp. PD38]|nr:hypothetical protein [Rhizonema sp. PD38]
MLRKLIIRLLKALVGAFAFSGHGKKSHRNGWQRLEGTRLEAMVISQLVPASNRLEVYNFDANYNWANSTHLQQYCYSRLC